MIVGSEDASDVGHWNIWEISIKLVLNGIMNHKPVAQRLAIDRRATHEG